MPDNQESFMLPGEWLQVCKHKCGLNAYHMDRLTWNL